MMPRTSLRELGRGYLAVAAGNYGAIGLSFAISVVLTHRLGAERFGGLALLVMVSQILSLVASHWTYVGFIGFAAREFASTGAVHRSLWARNWVVAPWMIACVVILLVARGPLAEYLGIAPWGLAFVYAHFLASYGLNTVGAVFQARNEMPRYGKALFFDKATTLTLLVALPAGWIDTPLRVIVVYTASILLVVLWGAIALGASALRPSRFDSQSIEQLWNYSMPLIFSTFTGLLGTNWFDFIIIKRYLNAADLGLYALATQLNGVVQQATIIFSTLLLPRLNVMVDRGEDEEIRQLVNGFMPYWILATAVVFGLVLIAARPLVPLVFGSEFVGTTRPFAILMLATGALTLFTTFSPILNAYGQTRQIALISIASASMNVLLNFAFIPRFGIEGAAAATVFAYGLSAVLVLVLVARRVGAHLYRLTVFGLPLVIASMASLTLEGEVFYLVSVGGLIATALFLMRAHGLLGLDAFELANVRAIAQTTASHKPIEKL